LGVSLELQNLDEIFITRLSKPPVIVNDASGSSESEKNTFNNLMYTTYTNTDLMSNIPKCACGEIVDEFNIGVICHLCGTPVTSPLEQDLEPLIWLRAPSGVRALMNPAVWSILRNHFSPGGFEIIRWMCDTKYKTNRRPPPEMREVIDFYERRKIERGFNNFYDRFDDIMTMLFNLKKPAAWREQIAVLREMITRYRDCIFSQYVPLPNRSMLVVEKTNVGTYVDPIVVGAIDAIRTMMGIDLPMSRHSVRTKENRAVRTTSDLADFYDKWHKTALAGKPGIARKHIYGTRCFFSFRTVISSTTKAHDHNTLEVPWGVGLAVMQLHLCSKLQRRGFTPNGAVGYLYEHAQKHSPLLEELLQSFIDESPYPGIPVVFQRNPSLERGSAIFLFITKFKTDPRVPTSSLSILDVAGLNADFDGDQLNGTLAIDHVTAEDLKNLAPYKSTHDLSAPRTISKNLSHPKPVVGTFAYWLECGKHETPDPVKLALMDAIPDA